MPEPAEGPLLAGITVTVFPGESSRSFAGVGSATGSAAAAAGMGVGAASAACITLGS